MSPKQQQDVRFAHEVFDSTHEAWLRVARGELSAHDAAELVGDAEPPELVERSRELFSPLSDDERAQQQQHLLELYGVEPASGSDEGEPVASIGEDRSRPGPVRWRWLRNGGLAAAAALLLWFSLGGRPTSTLPPIGVPYQLQAEGALGATRGVDDGGPVPRAEYDSGGTMEIWLRPAQPVEGPVVVLVYAVPRSGEPVRLSISPEISDRGFIRIMTGVRNAGLTEGSWDLHLAIGRPDDLPVDASFVSTHRPPSETAKYVVQRLGVEILASSR